MITIMRDYKRHTCTRDIPSILDPDLELYYVYNDHISIHNSTLPQNAEELCLALKEEWECIGQDIIDWLYDSLPAWVDEAIAAKGGNTKY
jgi:hypothetical protein